MKDALKYAFVLFVLAFCHVWPVFVLIWMGVFAWDVVATYPTWSQSSQEVPGVVCYVSDNAVECIPIEETKLRLNCEEGAP